MVSDSTLIILSMAGAITIIGSLIGIFKIRNINVQKPKNRIKNAANEGQIEAIDALKDASSETISFWKNEAKEKDVIIKKLRNSLNYYKGHADEVGIDVEPRSRPKTSSIDVDEQTINTRIGLIKEQLVKNNINPILLEIPEIQDAVRNIAGSDNFERIATDILKARNQQNPSNPNQANAQNWL